MRHTALLAALMSVAVALRLHDDGHLKLHHRGLHEAPSRRAEMDKDTSAGQETNQKRGAPSYHHSQNTQYQQGATQDSQSTHGGHGSHGSHGGYGGSNNDPYIETCLRHHNYHRRNHQAEDLQWDANLAYEAHTIASSCVYAHNQQLDPGAGQNIAAGIPAANVSGVITDLWYNNEIEMFSYCYGQPQPDYTNFPKWGHATQMLWRRTKRVGCATVYCPQGLANAGGIPPYFTVCNYKEPGNVAGEYADNVKPPRGAPQIHSWDY